MDVTKREQVIDIIRQVSLKEYLSHKQNDCSTEKNKTNRDKSSAEEQDSNFVFIGPL